jgi:hypothetical protein
LGERGGEGVCCDWHGVGLGPVALVEAAAARGRRVYRLRPAEEIARTLALAYGPFAADDLARRLSGLEVAARALEAGDLAKAMVAAVQLKLPPLAPEAAAKLARDPTLRKYSPDLPRDERGRWIDGSGGAIGGGDDATPATAKPVQVAANDTGVMNDAGSILPASTKPAVDRSRRVPVTLPDGSTVHDPYTNGPLLSPVADLRVLADAGRAAGQEYHELLSSPEGSDVAISYLVGVLGANLGHGGVFDYQRSGNSFTGLTQFPEFRDVSNFNVGLFCQQAGLTLEETLTIAGRFARIRSSNARPDQPYGLDKQTADLIRSGFETGASGVFGPAASRQK